ncbi:telomere-protecting terminal protein Tpg [Streptomyces liangshanensis]|uniref:telomere-protecting terminal protein Tpg n=1 Tax=Streptomyces liangshanensis TaxID=2717324 RepID=UPI0036D9050F
MDHISRALSKAAQAAAQRAGKRDMPKGAPARMRALVHATGSTKAAAAALGISPRTVERYLTGQIKRPRAGLADRLETALRQRWQPRLQRKALQAARASLRVETRAAFGYSAPGGTTDEARLRRIAERLTAIDGARLIDAYLNGASEQQLREILAEAIAHSYFRDGGRRAHRLDVDINDIDYVQFAL